MCRKLSKGAKRLAGMTKMLLINSNINKEEYDRWKLGQVMQEKYKHIVRACRDGVRKTRAHLELRLASYMKGNKSFYKLNQQQK